MWVYRRLLRIRTWFYHWVLLQRWSFSVHRPHIILFTLSERYLTPMRAMILICYLSRVQVACHLFRILVFFVWRYIPRVFRLWKGPAWATACVFAHVSKRDIRLWYLTSSLPSTPSIFLFFYLFKTLLESKRLLYQFILFPWYHFI